MKHNVLTIMNKKAEVEYQLLLSVLGTKKFPDPDFLEVFSYKCDNEWFKTEEFRMMLIDYRLNVYPRMLHKHLEKMRIDRYHANARAKRNRVKRKYTKRQDVPVDTNTATEITLNVKIVENL